MRGVTNGSVPTYPSGASLVFCVVIVDHCLSFLSPFLPALRFAVSVYTLGISKLFLHVTINDDANIISIYVFFLLSEILSGICQSPKYPLRYPSNTTSYCDINIENGYHGDVNIAFEFFEIQECSQCHCDRIDILVSTGSTTKISTGSTHTISTFCGSILPNGNGVVKGTFNDMYIYVLSV